MKMLTLLLLISCLPAYAADMQPSDQDQQLLQQAREARTYCEAKNDGPGTGSYEYCINSYLKAHYGWQVGTTPDGSLGVRSLSPFR